MNLIAENYDKLLALVGVIFAYFGGRKSKAI